MLTIQYEDTVGDLVLDVAFDGDTTWLNEDQIASLFDTSRSNIGQHIKKIYDDEELDLSTTLKKFLKVGENSKRYYVNHYNLDMIISVGYKVNSKAAVRYRRWATKIIREHVTGNYAALAQEEALRLLLRPQIDGGTTKLVSVATIDHKVKDEDSFLDAGDKGMYQASRDEVENNRKIPAGKLYDHIGSTELAMHLFRLTTTAEVLKTDASDGYIHDQEEAETIHFEMSETTRMMAHKAYGKYPEELPKSHSLEVLKAKNRSLLKRPKPLSNNPDQEKFKI